MMSSKKLALKYKKSGMKDLKVNRSTIPDWGNCKAIVLVYPYKIKGREHLQHFYDKLLTYIPAEIDIVLLVRDQSIINAFRQKCLNAGIKNNIEFEVYPDLFDIWVRDYAPLTVIEMGMLSPVKFEYKPSYVEKKFEKHVLNDHKAGELLGNKYVSKGMSSVYYHWDGGNLTHNGLGTAIISNRFISDNECYNINNEIRPLLHVILGFSNIIFIPVEPLDETGHVDGMVRFIDEKVLVVGAYPRHSENHIFMNKLAENLRTDLGDDYTILRLMNAEPEDYESEGIGSAVGNHMNFLRINELILFPYYSDKISKQPLMEFISELKNNNLQIRVRPVDIPEINELARSGGVLNCISWQTFSISK
jgi:agmatine deiminase